MKALRICRRGRHDRALLRRARIAPLTALACALLLAPAAMAGQSPPSTPPVPSPADPIIDNGVIQLGINPEAHLNTCCADPSFQVGTTNVGLRYLPTNGEATAPGCLCEGWGVANADAGTGLFTGYANVSSDGGVVGLSLVSTLLSGVGSDPDSVGSEFTSVVTAGAGRVQVTHEYKPSITPNLYVATVTIENLSATPIGDLRYRRVMDWDIPPTTFYEWSEIHVGTSANLVRATSDGFLSANPLNPAGPFVGNPPTTLNSGSPDYFAGPSDQGASFDFTFGALAPGAKKTFQIFYGGAANRTAALAALATVGAEMYSFGMPTRDDNGPATEGPNVFIFGFKGVGGTPVGDTTPPETTITLDPASPDVCCWYTFAVKVIVTATDPEGPDDVAETHCQLDGPPPADYDALVAAHPEPCPYLAPGAYVVSEGVHTLYAASKDVAGNEETIKSVTFKIDKSPPTSQVNPLPQFQPNPGPFTVSWSGSDTVSGIKDFDVRYRTAPAGGSFGPYVQWFTDTTLTSASFTPTPGSTTCFSVRARDRACWEQPTYSPEVCTTAPYDDPSLTRTGYWSTVSGSGYFGPGVSRSTTYGNKLTLTGLRASVIGVLVTKQPGGGPIELRWNGSTKLSTSLSAGSVQKKQLLTFTLPSVQNGTLEIVQTGYGTVDVDAAGAYKNT